MAIDKLNIPNKTDNAAKKKMVQSNTIGANETLMANEVNALVAKTNELVDAYNFGAPITAFNFKTNVTTYADLPLVGNEVNDGYGVIEDGLVYVWNGEAFPPEGDGMNLGLRPDENSTVEIGNLQAVSGDKIEKAIFGAERTDLYALLVNKGKRFPLMNYFTESITSVKRFKNYLLDAVIYTNDSHLYDYSISLLATNSPSGQRIDVRKKNKTTSVTVSTTEFRTIGGATITSEANKIELNKLLTGKIETISLTASDFKIEMTIDTSALDPSENFVAQNADWTNFIFSKSVYKKFEIGTVLPRLPKTYFVDDTISLTRSEIILKSDGSYTPASGKSSDIIPIDFSKEYYVTCSMAANSATSVAYYDSNDVFLGTQFPSTGTSFTVERQKLVPVVNATKFAFCSYGANFKVEYYALDNIASKKELEDTKTNVDTLQNEVENLIPQVEASSLITPDKIVKASVWEMTIKNRENELRKLLQDKIADDPGYVAPYYGIEWSEDHTDPNNVFRRGTIALHETLPIQNKIRRCVMKDGVVQYYLDANNSNLKADGVTPANLDGTDGDVMIEIPEFFFKSYALGGTNQVKYLHISEEGIPDFKFSPKHYISAFESTVDRENNKLASVCTTNYITTEEEIFIENASRYVVSDNTGFSLGSQKVLEISGYTDNAAKYRGVTNDDSLDDETDPLSENYSRNQLGRPVSNINRKTARVYADNANGLIQQYDSQKALYMLIMIEFATRQIQQPFLPNTTEGYKDGGLGQGAVKYPDYASYEKFYSPQGGNALIPCGLTTSLGNNSGEVYFKIKNCPISSTGSGSEAVYTAWGDVYMPVMSYRGIENFYGHIYKIVDNIDTNVVNMGGGLRQNIHYYQKNPYLCQDSDNKSGYKMILDVTYNSGIRPITKLMLGEDAHILPIDSDIETINYNRYYCDCVEHITAWNGNVGVMKYLTYNGRIVSNQLVGLLFSVIAVDMASNRARTSDGVRLQYF